ncbi:MAG: DNA-directed RNA polymerase subunit alpha C-terminal domain-containing protein [Planctomycetota bacterium]|jgi:DNA-directed RNA polymerase subunit alpha
MVTTATIDIREIVLSNQSFGPQDIERVSRVVEEDLTQMALLRDAVNELQQSPNSSPATMTRLGVCQYLLGKFDDAEETLRSGDGGALAQYYLGKVCFQLEEFDRALGYYEAAEKAGYTPEWCHLSRAEVLRYIGRKEEALKLLDNVFGPVEQTPEYPYQRAATLASIGGNLTEVIALYQRALQHNPRHAGALFGLAVEYDRMGNDNQAFELYQRGAGLVPAHVGTLINLGLMYEDRNDYPRAQACYRRVLETCPDHHVAILYNKDAACGVSVYDEEGQKKNERLSQLLNVPVTDFELSVRSRNCLQKMGIRTLGDLTRVSEQTLLSSKNFGETSLVEIKEMLTARGLGLGQFAHEKKDADPPLDLSGMTPDQQMLLDRPISELNLSVRARKCMVRLQLNTIGELIRKTGDDLLECKNFGVTSLTEVREKLTGLSLKLRGD